jgi:hypothetical protein
VGAAVTALASVATLWGALFRNRRDFRQTPIQARAGVLLSLQSVLWLVALGLLGLWMVTTPADALLFDWPGLYLLAASATALVATFLTLVCTGLAPLVIRSGRRLDSWSPIRRIAYIATVGVSLLFGLLLALWGGLSPWAG